MANILAVDDDADVRSLLCAALERDGHTVRTLAAGSGLTDRLCSWADCILLDVMMPGEDGFSACRRIRAMTDCPILFLTAKTEEADVIRGLGMGGDDYLTKPFRVSELRARVNAHLRREKRTPSSRMRRSGLDFDLGEKAVYHEGEQIKMTRSEYGICEYLATYMGQTFSKEQIYEAVFGYDAAADESAVTEHIKNIRAKLKRAGCASIETVWGVGYKWKKDAQ